MTAQLTHLLHRAARLRQRFESERVRDRHNPLLLLRLRNLMLRIEQRMQGILLGQRHERLVPQPVLLRHR